MAFDGLYKAGSVGIDILPDTSKFRERLRAELARVVDSVSVNVDPDLMGFTNKMRDVTGRDYTATVNMNANMRQIDRQLHAEQREWESRKITIPVEADVKTDRMIQAFDSLRAKALQPLDEQRQRLNRSLDKMVSEQSRILDKLRDKYAGLASPFESFDKWVRDNPDLDRMTKRYATLADSVDEARGKLKDIDRQTEQTAGTFAKALRETRVNSDAALSSLGRYSAMARNVSRVDAERVQQLKRTVEAQDESKRTADMLTSAMGRLTAGTSKMNSLFGDISWNVKATDTAYAHMSTSLDDATDAMQRQRARADEMITRLGEMRGHLSEMTDSLRASSPTRWYDDQTQAAIRLQEQYDKWMAGLRRNPGMKLDIDAQLGDYEQSILQLRRKLEEVQEDYDTLTMNVDVDLGVARAKLLAFARPRYVDVFARFHGTDLGRMIDGVTNKATGLATVNNQFSKLVNTFDSLDRLVPLVAKLGTAFSALSAGAVNLTGSALGVGASLVTMSNAALALPGALVGAGAALVVLRQAWGDRGGTFSEQIDIASTKVAGLGTAMVDAFYKDARPAIRSLVDDISGTLIPGMTSIATSEGMIVKGLADVIRESDKAGQLPTIFDMSNRAIVNLTPGLESLVRAFLTLGDTTSQYLPRAATALSNTLGELSNWVTRMTDTGRINAAMERAIEQFGYLKDSVVSAKDIITGLYEGLATTQNGLQGFSETIGKVARAVNGVKFQDVLGALREGAQSAQDSVRDSLGGIGDSLYSLRDELKQVVADGGVNVANGITMISRLLQGSQSGISAFSAGVRNGFAALSDAIGANAPMFNQLLTTAGSLAATMGNTLANALRVNAPLITALARAAQSVAEAFNALPAPIQQAIALYATFGKAGKSAIDALKIGLLENVQRTLQYRQALAELGVQAGRTGVGLREAMQAYMSANGFESSPVSGFTKQLREASGAGAKAKVAFNGLKAAGKGVIDVLGGPAMLGVGAAVGAVTLAVADYNAKASATAEGTQNLANALEALPTAAQSAEQGLSALSDFQQQVQSNLTNTQFGETGGNWLSDWATGFDSASDAAGRLGLETDDLSRAISGGAPARQKLLDQLNAQIDAGRNLYSSSPSMMSMYDDEARAAMKLRDNINSQTESYLGLLRQKAQNAGVDAEVVTRMDAAGNSAEQIAARIQYLANQETYDAKAAQLVAEAHVRQSTAFMQVSQSAVSYGNTLNSVQATAKQVQELAAKGQQVWDSQAASFDYSTQAGLTAANAMNQLASSSQQYLQAMVQSGSSVDEVNAKQKTLADSFVQTGVSMGLSRTQAEELQQQYSLTPEYVETLFKAETEQSKTSLLQYLDLIRGAFPDGVNGTAIYKTLIEAVTTGAVTDIDQLQQLADGYKNGQYTATLNADGTPAMDEFNRIANASIPDATVKVFADTSEAVAGIADVNSKPVDAKTVKLMADTLNALSGIDQVNGKPLDDKTAKLLADTAQAMSGIDVVNGTTLDDKTAKLFADTAAALLGIGQVNGTPLDDKTVALLANTLQAMSGIRDVNGAELHRKMVEIGADLSSYRATINGINGSKVGTVWFDARVRDLGNGNVNAYHRLASGGPVVGPGTSTSDSVHAMLSDGEYVLNAASVRRLNSRYGSGFTDHLNRTGSVPKVASMDSVSDIRNLSRSLGQQIASQIGSINITVPSKTDGKTNSLDASSVSSAVADGVARAMGNGGLRIEFDSRGLARLVAPDMSREIGLLERSGRIR